MLDPAALLERLATESRVELRQSGTVVETFDFSVDGAPVEALLFRPVGPGAAPAPTRYPAVLLIPGYSRTAGDYLPLGVRFARDGFVAVAITQPGFGKSAGPADFVGPRSMHVLETGLDRMQALAFVDRTRTGVFGYSRGAIAASLLATRRKDIKAAVFAAGIYDLKRAYDDIAIQGIRDNIKAETSLTNAALQERSSLFHMQELACPVLILHGEKDENAPVSQAKVLQARLTELKKDFQIRLFPDRDHDIGRQNLNEETLGFFKRNLQGRDR